MMPLVHNGIYQQRDVLCKLNPRVCNYMVDSELMNSMPLNFCKRLTNFEDIRGHQEAHWPEILNRPFTM